MESNTLLLIVAVVGGLLTFTTHVIFNPWAWPNERRQRRLPPGPRPKPLIGNLLDMPPPNQGTEAFWMRHRELYGGISYLSVPGSQIVMINDPAVARELLEKRSPRYSNRPVLQMACKLVGGDQLMLFTQPGQRLREARRLAQNQMGTTAYVARWKKEIDYEVCRYLHNTLEHPEAFRDHLRKEAAAVILRITYGYGVNPHSNDPVVDIAEEFMTALVMAAGPGNFLVDMFPVLKYVPDWFPGAGFQKQAKVWRALLSRLVRRPYEFTQKQMRQDVAPSSVVADTIRKNQGSMTEEDEDVTKWAAASMYIAGVDTTTVSMEIFYLAMLLNPSALAKAQQEIDRAVGKSRLPDVDDRPQLPYVEALIKECTRWEPLIEVTIPHANSEDDEYNGYSIPKQSTILVNLYGLYHDPKFHVDPMEFKPERFLGSNPEPNPFDTIWGYGRRICPGRYLADWNLWLVISRTIACFNIDVVPGRPPLRQFLPRLVRKPVHFEANIKPRSEEHAAMIRAAVKNAPFGDSGDGALLDP